MQQSLLDMEQEVGSIITKPHRPKKSISYGKRVDGTEKGSGFLGELPMKDGSDGVMTEFSIGVNIDNKEMLIPSVVPTLTTKELDHLLKGGDVNDKIIKKAVEHARKRMKEGKSPFYQEGE